MKLLIIVALALAFGVLLIWAADFEPGFVLLQYGSWSLETSLVVFSAIFLVLLIAGYILLRSLVVLRQAPSRLAAWNQTQRHKKANQALTRGLITLEEGRWAEAERILIRHANDSDTPLLHYLAAARVAQKQQAPDRRDNYLRLAHETTKGADIAVGVVQAELQLSAGQKEQALATLQHLREVAPKHPYVLQLLQTLYQEMEQWQEVQSVLPDLRRSHVLPSADVIALSQDASVGQLEAALARQDWHKFSSVWENLPIRLRQTESLLKPYIKGLILQRKDSEAVVLIEQFLRSDWSNELVYLYGKLEEGDLLKRLATAEKWLKDHSHNPWLLMTLGRLAKANGLWMKAEEYLRASLSHHPRGETYQLLAEVLTAEGLHDAAAETYRQGLDMVLKQSEEH